MSKGWKSGTDYWKIKLFTHLTYRTHEGVPIIRAYTDEVPKKLIPANIKAGQKIKIQTKRDGFAHFYLDDYQFERFWNYPIRYTNYLSSFDGVLSPDYSVYEDYPIIIQKMNVYRNRALGAYWQSLGINVIPSVSWNTQSSFEYCFEGIEEGSIVAISTVGVLRTKRLKELLLIGFGEMINRIKPKGVLIYGSPLQLLYTYNIPIYKVNPFYYRFNK